MTKRERLKNRIREELAQHPKIDRGTLMGWLAQGEYRRVLEELFFFTESPEFVHLCQGIMQDIEMSFPSMRESGQECCLGFLAEFSIWLQSYLPNWHLLNGDKDALSSVSERQLTALAARAALLIAKLAQDATGHVGSLTARWRKDIASRLAAESVPNPQQAAAALVGEDIGSYLTNMTASLRSSNARGIADLHAKGATPTEISNDYAAFLDYAMLLGASFVTCNPPLVDIAWVADPERWNPVVDRIVQEDPGASSEALATKVTLEIVLANMRLLRPVFLLTEGCTGYVSLQVNPRNHDNSSAMVSEAITIYSDLEKKLGGGVPNVVFKLPATHAGLVACRDLTGQGIGVNITVGFGMFQHVEFAQAIQEGEAIVSTITNMSGRLAFPVRDELLGIVGRLAKSGIGEVELREAAAWSGVAVVKRLHQLMARRGYDLGRVKPLVASLRVYEGGAYEGLPTPVPDISEVIGVGVITIFPNVRRAFDALPPMKLRPHAVESPVPKNVLDVLRHSEVFKQAFYVGDPELLPEEDDQLRPDHPLCLDDEADVLEWTPVRNTIAEFCKSYDAFETRIEDRRQLAGRVVA